MKQIFTYNETRLIILIIILSMMRGIYNLYILYEIEDNNLSYFFSSSEKLSDKVNDFSFFSIVQFLISVIYLFSSVNFFLNDKIKNVVFAMVCLFMFIRSMLYFMIRFLGDIPFIPNDIEPKYIYTSFLLSNLLMFFVSFYFIKVIFFS
jgi:hypothetical protein